MLLILGDSLELIRFYSNFLGEKIVAGGFNCVVGRSNADFPLLVILPISHLIFFFFKSHLIVDGSFHICCFCCVKFDKLIWVLGFV